MKYSPNIKQEINMLQTQRVLLFPVIQSLRPYQWIKNVLVFAALLFSLSLFKWDLVMHSMIAFWTFCFAGSTVYLFNDIKDFEEDKVHPEKKHRPIASGALSKKYAYGIMFFLGVGAILLSTTVNSYFTLIICIYLLMNFSYSLGLKRVVILDVLIVSMGFVLRAAAGAVAIDVQISSWLFLCTLFLALLISFGKRRNEMILLKDTAIDHRHILSEYSVTSLNLMMAMSGGAAIITYALYTMSPETINRIGTANLIITTPMVLYGVFRYFHLVLNKNEGGDPSKLLATDIPSILNVFIWAAVSAIILYSLAL